jgi:hypothetical protein
VASGCGEESSRGSVKQGDKDRDGALDYVKMNIYYVKSIFPFAPNLLAVSFPRAQYP